MNVKDCNLCGMLVQQSEEFCETCAQMMTQQTTAPTETRTAQPGTFQPGFYPKPPAANQYPAINAGLAKSNEVVSTYKPGKLDWFWDLPLIVKGGLGLVVVFLVFGLVLKAFMRLDVSVVKTDSASPAVQVKVEETKPWFSSWFRDKPTPEEIFDKYETTTLTKGKMTSAQSYILTGNISVIKTQAGDVFDLDTIYKSKGTSTMSPTQKEMSLHNGSFELYLKLPNKWALRGETMVKKPTILDTKIVPINTASDGQRVWGMTKGEVVGGVVKNDDIKSPTQAFYVNPTLTGISLAFVKSSYEKLEAAEDDVVFSRKCYQIKATDSANAETQLFFDMETGLLSKVVQKNLTLLIIDHEMEDGILLPTKFVYKLNQATILLSIEKIQTNPVFSDSVFVISTF